MSLAPSESGSHGQKYKEFMSKHSWKKFRPQSNEELERLLLKEKHLTAAWYRGMSQGWEIDRRRVFDAMDEVAAQINKLLREQAADDFSALPD